MYSSACCLPESLNVVSTNLLVDFINPSKCLDRLDLLLPLVAWENIDPAPVYCFDNSSAQFDHIFKNASYSGCNSFTFSNW
jgi:hypothetical protein